MTQNTIGLDGRDGGRSASRNLFNIAHPSFQTPGSPLGVVTICLAITSFASPRAETCSTACDAGACVLILAAVAVLANHGVFRTWRVVRADVGLRVGQPLTGAADPCPALGQFVEWGTTR